jgi:3-oxoacyl-[acyl-carrier protein] reductase
MDLGLENRRAVVIGGGKGLGRGIAAALAAEGADVHIAGRNEDALERAADEIGESAGKRPVPIACDLARPAEIESLIIEVGNADILINNCGGPPAGPIAAVGDDAWLANFETMFLGAVRLTRGFLPGMRERGWGRILTIVSSGVIQPIPNLGISNALRLALVGWSKTLAGEVAADGVTVNCIAPGRIHTDRIDQLDAGAAERQGKPIEQVRAESANTIPAARYGQVEEFAAAAVFLVSARASYLTGSVHRVDGGFIRSI